MKIAVIKLIIVALVLTLVSLATKANANAWECGNVDGSPGGGVDLGDLTALIDYLFISHTEPASLEAADMDGCTGVDVGDLDALIMYFFHTLPPSPLNCSTVECPIFPSGSITLDHVEGLLEPGVLMTDMYETHFYLRITNDSISRVAIANGFQLYSPDGATWGSFTAEIVEPGRISDLKHYVETFSADGQDADTVGFGAVGVGFDQVLLPPDFDEVVYKITIGSISHLDEGKTIILDTCFFPPAGTWKWGPSEAPAWGGPYYFSIGVFDPRLPTIENCPKNYTFDRCDVGTYDFDAVDVDDDLAILEYSLLSGPGSIDPVTGVWTWSRPEVEPGFYPVCVAARIINSTNQSPGPLCCMNVEVISAGDSCVCCVGLAGNVDCDQEDICDLGDLTKMIDYLFISFEEPTCREEANLDASVDGIVDLSDLTRLIDYLFISLTPPAACL